MAPKQKMNREEILLKKRIKERERYLKIKEDPIKRELQKEKERLKYKNKKERKPVKKVKSVNEMTPREVRLKRKLWRKYSKNYYQKHKNKNVLPDNLPSSDDNSPAQVLLVEVNSGRKRIHRDHSKIIEQSRRLHVKNEKLIKSQDKYKKSFFRVISKYSKKPILEIHF